MANFSEFSSFYLFAESFAFLSIASSLLFLVAFAASIQFSSFCTFSVLLPGFLNALKQTIIIVCNSVIVIDDTMELEKGCIKRNRLYLILVCRFAVWYANDCHSHDSQIKKLTNQNLNAALHHTLLNAKLNQEYVSINWLKKAINDKFILYCFQLLCK